MKLGIVSPRVLIRRALSTLLGGTGAAVVVIEGDNLSDSLDEIRRSSPEMLIVDVGGKGLEALPDLKQLGLSSKVVVLMESHVKAIYRKLKIKGRRNAMFRYLEFFDRPPGRQRLKVAKVSARSSS